MLHVGKEIDFNGVSDAIDELFPDSKVTIKFSNDIDFPNLLRANPVGCGAITIFFGKPTEKTLSQAILEAKKFCDERLDALEKAAPIIPDHIIEQLNNELD